MLISGKQKLERMRDGRAVYDGPPLGDHEVHGAAFAEPHAHHHHPRPGPGRDPARPGRHDHVPHVSSPLERP